MTAGAMATAGAAAAAGIAALAWLGLRVRPRPLSPPEPGEDAGEVSLPGDLPKPVARFYQALGSGDLRAKRVNTFALWGRARMKQGPLPWMPVTFWSEHRAGWSGLQLLAVTWYRIPILRARDAYLDERGEMTIGRRSVSGPEMDQGENLFLWAELVLVPSVLATRPGVRWEPIDDFTARLVFPFGDTHDEMVFQFDPATGLLEHGTAMRYQRVGGPKIGWRIGYHGWRWFDAGLYPSKITVTWLDSGRPWFIVDVDGIATNAPVSELLTAGSPATSRPSQAATSPSR
jgi:Family of unknown function (DUF6544)